MPGLVKIRYLYNIAVDSNKICDLIPPIALTVDGSHKSWGQFQANLNFAFYHSFAIFIK